jgi:Flp pilus assembly protein TadG
MSFHSALRTIRKLGRSRRGAVLIETAFATPILFIALAGITDLAMMALTRFKLSSGANNISTMVASGGRALDEAEMTDVLDNIDKVVAPIKDFGTNGKVIIAAVESTNEAAGGTKVTWNRCIGSLDISDLSANQRALAATDGTTYNLPSTASLEVGLTTAVVQISYKYKPMFLGYFLPDTGKIITKTYVQRTRYGEFIPTVTNRDPSTNSDDAPVRNC